MGIHLLKDLWIIKSTFMILHSSGEASDTTKNYKDIFIFLIKKTEDIKQPH